MDFLKFASDRYSVRKFEDKHLEKNVIDQILACGHVAPTGCNFQPQRILVLNTDETIEKLKKCTPCHFNAPTAMIVCYNKKESWIRKHDKALSAPVDASIVATHLTLMAHSLGVGSCFVMAFDPDALRTEFEIPQDFEICCVLVMGYPHPEAKPLDMHSKFRPIDEVVFFEKF